MSRLCYSRWLCELLLIVCVMTALYGFCRLCNWLANR